jgi:dienelactone hydrolase
MPNSAAHANLIDTTGVFVPAGLVTLHADLSIPAHPLGVIVFAHGSGSSRLSPRNQRVASTLVRAGFATLLLDLLTEGEEAIDAATGTYRFDIPRLAERLVHATDWVHSLPVTHQLPIGYFGASTGAGAALIAAAQRPALVGAVVSRGGRPDLAGDALMQVRAPTLLVVGELDTEVLDLTVTAQRQMQAQAHVVMVWGATHLFEEPGAMEEVARLAKQWFLRHLVEEPREARERTT